MPWRCSAVTSALAFDGVTRRFRGGGGVTDVSLQVASGEIVALLGLNGAGKTTLMRLALGMLRPRRGSVQLFGRTLPTLPAVCWAEVGAVIETPPAYPELTVAENLHIARRLRGLRAPKIVDDAVAAWQLGAVVDRRFRRLSMGNRQRVGLAAAMQHDPRLIVLDEPTTALDPTSVLLLREQLSRRAGHGAAILISSHHLDEVARIADRVLLMNAGRLIGELETTGPDLERVFFERIRQGDERRLGQVAG